MKNLYLLLVLICTSQLSIGQFTVNTNSSNSTICAGSSATITASVTPNNGDPITYSWSPSTGLNTTTGATVIATPTETGTYTVTATNTSTSETASTNVTITIDAASNTLAGISGGAQVCQNITISPAGYTFRDNNCNIIADVIPDGADPVSGIINACVRIDTGANKMGSLDLYVARRYDIEPETNAENATANITLYFLQSEFDNYNAKCNDSGLYKIPVSPFDADGINNLRLRQFHGTGTVPGLYTGNRQDFRSTTPGVSIIWNSDKNWWEITVPVTGFSGFYVSSRKGSFATLPVNMEYFKGYQADKKSILTWKANCTSQQVIFDVERSINGQTYTALGRITADQARCSEPFEFIDVAPVADKNYYRIKVIDADGEYKYSNIIQLGTKNKRFELSAMTPNIITGEIGIANITSKQKAEVLLAVTDMNGRRLNHITIKLREGSNQVKINTGSLSQGSYMLSAYMAGEQTQSIRFIKQ